MPRGAIVLGVVLAFTSSGCTLVGLGVGSTVDRYRRVPVQAAPRPDCGSERAVLKAAAPAFAAGVAPSPDPTSSTVAATRFADVATRTSRGLVVIEGGASREVDWSLVDHTECKVGSYAGVGAAVGGAIDVTIAVAALAVVISQADFHIPRMN